MFFLHCVSLIKLLRHARAGGLLVLAILTIIHEAKGDGMGMAVDVVVEPHKKGKVFTAAERFMIFTSTLSHSHPTERNSAFPVTAESLLSFRFTAESLLSFRITFRLQLADSPEWTSSCGRLALQAQAQKLKRKFELKILDQFQAFIIEDVWANYNPELIKMDLGICLRSTIGSYLREGTIFLSMATMSDKWG